MADNLLRPEFFHPKYWPVWFGMGCWWLLVQLPLGAQTAIASVLGDLSCIFRGRRVRVAERNLQLCFPDWNKDQRARVLRSNMRNTFMGFFETGISWWWPAEKILRYVDFEGQDILDDLLRTGGLLLGYHATCLEIGGVMMSSLCPLDMVYRPHNNALYDYFQRRGRTSNGRDRGDGMAPSHLFDRADIRGQVKALKQGRILWSAFDQDAGKKRGVFVPFFGIQASTYTAPSTLSKLAKVPVATLVMFRRENGRYCVKVQSVLDNFPSGDDTEDARRYNEIGEQEARQHPEFYFWVHRRFKTRPEGEVDRYQGI